MLNNPDAGRVTPETEGQSPCAENALRELCERLQRERDDALHVRDLAREASNRDLEAKRVAERERDQLRARLALLVSTPLTVNGILATSLSRVQRWHKDGLEDWSPLEWSGAMAGEAGEACNAAKKLKRLDKGLRTINAADRHYSDCDVAAVAVAREAADTILYAILVMARVGVTDVEEMLRSVFNAKSEEYGFPERL
jgi:hypothetical protein